MDERRLKIRVPRIRHGDLPILPYSFLPYTPHEPCVFDSYRGTVGFDIFPFAITTRVSAADQIYLKVYEDVDDTNEGERV